MKFIKQIAAILTGACLLCGCTRSNIINPEPDPDLPTTGQEGIVWEQLWEDFQDTYSDTDAYPYVETSNATVYPEDNTIKFFILLNQEISREEAADFAMTVIKGLNDLAAGQNASYGKSSDTSYGGFVSKYNIYVMVSADDTKSSPSGWLLEDTIPAGEYRPVNPDALPAER